MQAGRLAAQVKRDASAKAEEEWHDKIHKQAYADLLRMREEEETRTVVTDWLDIGE